MVIPKKLRLILVVCLTSALTYAFIPIQQGVDSDYKSTVLLPLVGKKVEVMLLSGENVKGTLWDFGQDYINVKTKKGLLYSKTEKLRLSEIEWIEDPNGIKVSPLELETIEAIAESKQSADKPESTSTLYFHTDDLLEATEDGAEQERAFGTTGLAQGTKAKTPDKPTVAPKSSYSSPVKSRPSSPNTVKRNTSPTRVASRPRTTPRSTTQKKPSAVARKTPTPPKTQKTLVAKKASEQPRQTAQTETKPEPRAAAAAKPRPGALAKTIVAKTGPVLSKKDKILSYQNQILFGISALAFSLLILMKVKEAKGSAYGQGSLFPANVVKRNGRFGLIDQGSLDGLKLGDVLKLYHKEGKHVDFKGKAHVRKVAEKFSLVEMAKNGKPTAFQIGDVGFLDRSFTAKGARGLRLGFGSVLGGLASGMGKAAKNLHGGTDEPAPEPQVIKKTPAPTPVRIVQRPVKQTNTPVQRPSAPKTVVAGPPKSGSRKPSLGTVGFGLDEL